MRPRGALAAGLAFGVAFKPPLAFAEFFLGDATSAEPLCRLLEPRHTRPGSLGESGATSVTRFAGPALALALLLPVALEALGMALLALALALVSGGCADLLRCRLAPTALPCQVLRGASACASALPLPLPLLDTWFVCCGGRRVDAERALCCVLIRYMQLSRVHTTRFRCGSVKH
eukprot:5627207-Amphidinium_carterae.1